MGTKPGMETETKTRTGSGEDRWVRQLTKKGSGPARYEADNGDQPTEEPACKKAPKVVWRSSTQRRPESPKSTEGSAKAKKWRGTS